MNLVQTRGELMAEYASNIAARLLDADESLRSAVANGDTGALLVGMAEREAALVTSEELVGDLDLAGLSAAEHASIIRTMVKSLERSQVAQAALEAELFESRRRILQELGGPAVRRDVVAPPVPTRGGYSLNNTRKTLGKTG